ncbi:MAG: SDR family NAD(P)-dependent oxidoreductase [Sandaracinaceae bacterium]
MSFEDTNVLITGASRGLGRALAEGLAARGAHVVMVARAEEPLLEAVSAIRAAGGDAHAFPIDVTEDPARIVGGATAMVGPIDLVIHNASTLGPVPLLPLAETSDEELRRTLEVNLVAPFRITRAIVDAMVQRGAGTLVTISSDAAVEAYPTWGAYSISKAALDHLARVWAAELDGTGVTVVAVDPGEMDTKMHADAIPDADPKTLADPRDVADRLIRVLEIGEGLSGQRLSASELARRAS